MVKAPLMLRNILLNEKLSTTCQERTLRIFLIQFFSLFNKCHYIITYFIIFLFFFQLLQFIMEGNLVLIDVLIIEQFFSNILKNVSLQLLCKEDPHSRIQKNGIQKSPFKKLINGITCIFQKTGRDQYILAMFITNHG